MNVIQTPIADLLIFEPKVHGDSRGWFIESFNQNVFDAAVGHHVEFVQDNHSFSRHGVLRGLHYQTPPHAQGKLVRVVQGAVWDVAVDIRRSSATFGQHFGLELSATNRRQFWIPPGFAHGFVVLSETADFLYKTTDVYSPACDRVIRWQDPDLNVAWPLDTINSDRSSLRDLIQISAKDEAGVPWSAAEVFE